jgi:hypothetical protein
LRRSATFEPPICLVALSCLKRTLKDSPQRDFSRFFLRVSRRARTAKSGLVMQSPVVALVGSPTKPARGKSLPTRTTIISVRVGGLCIISRDFSRKAIPIGNNCKKIGRFKPNRPIAKSIVILLKLPTGNKLSLSF